MLNSDAILEMFPAGLSLEQVAAIGRISACLDNIEAVVERLNEFIRQSDLPIRLVSTTRVLAANDISQIVFMHERAELSIAASSHAIQAANFERLAV